MLYLQVPAAPGATCSERLPITELTALGFERALLATDTAQRQRELATTLARDPVPMEWATRLARASCAELIRSDDDAIAWLAPRLEVEFARALARSADVESEPRSETNVEIRLAALATRLAECARERAEFDSRLERAKLEAMKELAYGASHEINNPLANIAARAQSLLDGETEPERRRKLVAIHRQAMRAHEMIADLMLFARPPRLSRAPCDLGEIARSVVGELGERANEQGTQLSVDPVTAPLIVPADATQLGVAVHAVVRNSLEAVGEGGHVLVGVQCCDIAGEPGGEISIRDDGPGISDEVRQHMFDPFFSGREAGRGLGFGLSKCWRIVTDHGGQLVAHQLASGGTEFTMQFPLAGSTANLPAI